MKRPHLVRPLHALGAASLALSLAGCDAASGAGYRPPAFTQSRVEPQPRTGACLPQHLEPAPIVAFGAYEGARKLGIRLGQAEHETTLISITGNGFGEDRILLLMAYEPTVWDFTNAPVERISAVIVSGYYDQAVSNLPASTPVVFSSVLARRNICGGLAYAYRGGPDLDEVVRNVETATGLTVESFDGIYSAHSAALGNALRHSNVDAPAEPGEIRATVRVTVDPVAPRERGLRELVERRVIRPATAADIARWNRAATRRLRSGHLAAFRSQYLGALPTYVVLAPMVTPAGMYGAHSRSFIVERGVPMPEDRGSHNSYYRIEDGSCTGADPECRALGLTPTSD